MAVGVPAVVNRPNQLTSTKSFNSGMLLMGGTSGNTLMGLSDETPMGLTLLRSEEHTSELQSLMRISYAVFCLKKKKHHITSLLHIDTVSKDICYDKLCIND